MCPRGNVQNQIKLSPPVVPCPPSSNPRLQAVHPPACLPIYLSHPTLNILPSHLGVPLLIVSQAFLPTPCHSLPNRSPETALFALLIPSETGMRDMRARRRFEFTDFAPTSCRPFRFGLDEIFVVDFVVGILGERRQREEAVKLIQPGAGDRRESIARRSWVVEGGESARVRG